MKKCFKIFILIFVIFLFGDYSVSARECVYKRKETFGDHEIKYTSIEKDGNIDVKCTVDDVPCDSDEHSYYTNVYNFVDTSKITNDDFCFESLYVCTMTVKSQLVTTVFTDYSIYLGIFGSSMDPYEYDDAIAEKFITYGVCETVSVEGLSDLTDDQRLSFCQKFSEMFDDLQKSYEDYKSCGEKEDEDTSVCRGRALSQINSKTDVLKDSCNSILQNQDITADDGCVKSCLNANKAIQKLNATYIKSSGVNECSISGRLIIWISNIVSWAKYIVPVVVIILGILDFLKAIATGNDDNMKKSQGKFIKRLIAAALIFIVPFILYFILDKMGFTYNGCGVIKL